MAGLSGLATAALATPWPRKSGSVETELTPPTAVGAPSEIGLFGDLRGRKLGPHSEFGPPHAARSYQAARSFGCNIDARVRYTVEV